MESNAKTNIVKENASTKFWKSFKRYIFMMIGCLSYALSTRLFLDPNNIFGGGVSGASLLIEFWTDKFILAGTCSIIINIPILILGFKLMGWKFILNSFITIATLGLFTDLLEPICTQFPPITNDKLLAAGYAGLLQGIGIGLFIKYEMSSAGTELLGRLTHHVLPFGTIATHVALFDGFVVLVGAFKVGPENILYALILIFLSAKVSDLIVFGLTKAKMCYIITEKADEIAEYLISHSPRGVTKVDGEGMYSKTEKGVLFTCVKSNQIVGLKSAIKKLDENAFVIVCDANEVYGKGFHRI